MHFSKFEIECDEPEIIMKAVQIDDKSEVQYSCSPGKLIFEVKNECLKSLMKISYSACNRIQLAIETTNKFRKEK
jgi:hypothetical protein